MDPRTPGRWISTRELILPDNSTAGTRPVYFEGTLKHHWREAALVFADLDAPISLERSAEGILCFRGSTAVILRGPAVVRLAYPFSVECLPAGEQDYWDDLRLPRVQFNLPI